MTVPSKRVATSQATKKTIHRRLQHLRETRDTLGVELEDEVRALPKERRQKLLQEVGLPLEIPAPHALAMKATLAISWTKLRTLRRYIHLKIHVVNRHGFTSYYRWLKTFNISLASERRQRIMATTEAGDNLCHEMVPFVFPREGGGESFREAPFVYVQNLIAKISDRLSAQKRYNVQ